MAVDFNKDFISQITADGKSRGDALRGSSLVDIISNRTDISDKVKAARTQVLSELGASGITLGDITEETPAGKQLFNSIIEKGSTNSVNGFIGDFKSILAEVGVTAQGTTNPFRTMLKNSVGEAGYLKAGFSTDVSRLIPFQFPQEVYTESKRIAAGLMADPNTRPAGGRMLMMMMGGYRPSDFKALKIENIDFNTGLVKGLELKTDAKPGKKSSNVKIGYLPTAQRDIIKSIIGDKTSGLVFEKPSSLDKTIGDALKSSAIPDIEYLQESTGKYVKQPFSAYDWRRIVETSLSAKGYSDDDLVRKALTWRPPAGNVQKYQAVIDQSGAIEEANARAFEPYVLLTEGNRTTGPDGKFTLTHGQFLSDVGVTQLSPYTQRYTVSADGVSKLPVHFQEVVQQKSQGVSFSDKTIASATITVDPLASDTFVELSKTQMETQLLEAEAAKRTAQANMPPKPSKLASADADVVPESNPEARANLERKGFDAKSMADGINKYLGKVPGPVKKALGPLGLGLTAATAASTVTEVEAATDSPTLAAIAGASEFGPIGYSDVRDIAAGRSEPDTFGTTPASRIAAEEQAGFIDLGRDRGPEAAPATEQDQGFLTR